MFGENIYNDKEMRLYNTSQC